jgi:hypothetical protein
MSQKMDSMTFLRATSLCQFVRLAWPRSTNSQITPQKSHANGLPANGSSFKQFTCFGHFSLTFLAEKMKSHIF